MSIHSTSYVKIASQDWSSKLGELGQIVEGLDDISQCIEIILTTPKGSVPHRLDFGCDIYKFVDSPPAAASSYIVSEVYNALSKWEPRITVESVQVVPNTFAHYTIQVNWSPNEDYVATSYQTISQEVVV